MIDEETLLQMTEGERRELLRRLCDMESDEAQLGAAKGPWEVALLAITICCVVLAIWIGFLAVTLPPFYRTGSWRGAWVGFDLALLAAFVTTGWAAWRRRQMLIVSLIVLATLLACDAWFDVVLDVRTSDFWLALASALAIELPMAALATVLARRLVRMTIGQIMRYEGLEGPVPPLRQIPLIGPVSAEPLHRLIARREAGPQSGRPGPG